MGSGVKKGHESFTVAPADNSPADTSPTNEPTQTSVGNVGTPLGEGTAEPTGHGLAPAAVSVQAQQKVGLLVSQLQTEDLAAGSGQSVDPQQMPAGATLATPAEVIEAQTAFTAALHTVHQTAPGELSPDDLDTLIKAEDTLASVWCPQVAQQHAEAVAQARLSVDEIIASHPDQSLAWVTTNAHKLPPEASGSHLSLSQTAQLIRKSTAPSEYQYLSDLATNRQLEASTLTEAHNDLAELNSGDLHGPIESMGTAAEVSDWIAAAHAYVDSKNLVTQWNHEPVVMEPYEFTDISSNHLEATFRKKAKTVPLGTLREAAISNGMEPTAAKVATRAQVQNWLLASTAPGGGTATKTAIMHQISPKLTPPLKPQAPTTAVTPPAGHTTAHLQSPVSGLAGNGHWAAGHKSLVASLKHQASALRDLPARPDAGQVQQWQFTPGPQMNLGGAHTKSVLTAPDGSHWLFKPDRHGGARAIAEAAASTVLHRAGIPTVPVFSQKVNGKHGAIQPLLAGASQMSADPKQWSQADVDAIVRFHTAAWLVGNHDAKHDNMLRTPSGGLVPIDHGQAFKYFGEDTLSSSYHPNGSFGAREPLWITLYTAAKTGGLAPGVRIRASAATPTIQAIEAIPDDEYRSTISPVAKAGASRDQIHWSTTMKKRAAKAAGTAAPTPDQIAEQFIQHAVDRKRSIRKTFLDFFTAEGLTDSDLLTKVA